MVFQTLKMPNHFNYFHENVNFKHYKYIKSYPMKFVYVLVLFISIFLVIIICDSAYLPNTRPCITDKDCAQVKNYTSR